MDNQMCGNCKFFSSGTCYRDYLALKYVMLGGKCEGHQKREAVGKLYQKQAKTLTTSEVNHG